MKPEFAAAVNRIGQSISRHRRSMFINFCSILFNAGAGAINLLKAWAKDCWPFILLAGIELAVAGFLWVHQRRIRRHLKTLVSLRRDFMRADAATSRAELECLADQIDHHFNLLLDKKP